jgi:23S rRNA (cytidine1920-2'-O)/16S rRNA (cytidine1409-2'-O)-methyltransferase
VKAAAARPARRRAARARLDLELVERGLAESRAQAQALIMAGRVRVDGAPATKPGAALGAGARLELLPGRSHVGRGALKLAGALEAFGLDPAGLTALDVGASTGGFTETLLERGARRVYAVDVGRAQLHERLRRDPRVVVREKLNARSLTRSQVPEACGLAVMDVSFISVLKILPALREVLAAEADVIVLVKPQFEVGRGQVGRGGIVSDRALQLQALAGVARGAEELGYAVLAACASPIAGARGNREFFLRLRIDAQASRPDLERALRAAVDA